MEKVKKAEQMEFLAWLGSSVGVSNLAGVSISGAFIESTTRILVQMNVNAKAWASLASISPSSFFTSKAIAIRFYWEILCGTVFMS